MAQKKMMGFPVGLETKSDGNTSPKECPETIRVCVSTPSSNSIVPYLSSKLKFIGKSESPNLSYRFHFNLVVWVNGYFVEPFPMIYLILPEIPEKLSLSA